MVVPLVGDEVWLAGLSALPAWRPPVTHTLLLSPHPDDETLGAGGLIASLRGRNVPVTVVAVTDGEAAYTDTPNLAEVREREQAAAVRHLGVAAANLVRLRLPDSGLRQHEAEIVERVVPLATNETHILAPWTGDFHPDHEVCGQAAASLAERTGAALTFYFFWTWHRGTPQTLTDRKLVRFDLSAAEQCAKAEALLCHRSQLQRNDGAPILPENLLGPARWPFEVYLPS